MTQKAIERAIRAAQACGLKIIGVRPDGTVLTEPPEEAADPSTTTRERMKAMARDIEARRKKLS